jgi:hypothetical protein
LLLLDWLKARVSGDSAGDALLAEVGARGIPVVPVDLTAPSSLGELLRKSSAAPLTLLVSARGSSRAQLEETLRSHGVTWFWSGDQGGRPIALVGKYVEPPAGPLRPKARVLAIVSVYDDQDIIEASLRHLIRNGVDVWAMDNWSADGTFEVLEAIRAVHPQFVELQRFPPSGPGETYDWSALFKGKEQIARRAKGYDWIIHCASDELRVSPWPNLSLQEAFAFVDSLGFNAVDHTVLDFRPTREGFTPDDDPEKFFSHFELGRRAGDLLQINSWKRIEGCPVDLSSSRGYEAKFEGRRVFPIKFLIKRYALRSQEPPVAPVAGFTPFHPDFEERFLLERAFGVGLKRP